MIISVREMKLSEADLIISYFYHASPEHLEMLGVDPTRLRPQDAWHDFFRHEYSLAIEKRTGFFVIWLSDDFPVGFSSCNKIVYGERANMHLHITEPHRRKQGIGTECVRRSIDIYFDSLKLKALFCEPNAFNTGPNRTLQRAGFKYVKTHMTVPGPMNYHQAVTRWVIER